MSQYNDRQQTSWKTLLPWLSSQGGAFWVCPSQQIRLVMVVPQHGCTEPPAKSSGTRCGSLSSGQKSVVAPGSSSLVCPPLSSQACCLTTTPLPTSLQEQGQSFLIAHLLLRPLYHKGHCVSYWLSYLIQPKKALNLINFRTPICSEPYTYSQCSNSKPYILNVSYLTFTIPKDNHDNIIQKVSSD